MARGRMLSKSLSTSEKFANLHTAIPELAECAQVLYMLLVTHSDDFGRQEGNVFTVKNAVMQTSPRTMNEIQAALVALDHGQLIDWYHADGHNYIQIKDFDTHQAGLHKRTESRFPESPGISGNVPPNLIEPNLIEPKRREVRTTARLSARDVPGQAKGSYRIISKLVRTLFDEDPSWVTSADLIEEIKCRCATHKISYDATTVARAIESESTKWRRRTRKAT